MPTSNKYTKAKQNMFDIWQKMLKMGGDLLTVCLIDQ